MNRRSLIMACAVLLAAATGVSILAWHAIDESPALAAVDLARGQILYAQQCAVCHGQNLEGQPNWRQRRADGRLPAPPHDASGHTWHHADAQLIRIIKEGVTPLAPPGYVSDMPGFATTLSDTDILAILAYIKSYWPEDIRARQAKLS